MNTLVLDKTGWLRMFDPWILSDNIVDKILIQAFNLNNPIDVAYIPFLLKIQQSKIEVYVVELISKSDEIDFPFRYGKKVKKSKREAHYADSLLWFVDLLRYNNKFFDDYSDIKTRGIHWIHTSLITKTLVLFILKLTPLFLSRFLERVLIKFALEAKGRLNPLIDHFESIPRIPDNVILMPFCHSSLLNYDQVFLARRFEKKARILALIGSWDNLTNKGSIKFAPDVLLVWNDIQEKEARNLSPVKLNLIKQIGSIGTYKWTSRRIANRAIQKSRLIKTILYACSSGGITDDEVPAILYLINLLESTSNPETLHLKIRTHPKKPLTLQLDEFRSRRIELSLSDGRLADATDDAQEALYLLLQEADLIVGINTSIFVECAIFGHRPVTLKEFRRFSMRHPHERVIFDGCYGIEYCADDFLAEIETNKLWERVRRAENIESFLKTFHQLRPGYSPSNAFKKLVVDA